MCSSTPATRGTKDCAASSARHVSPSVRPALGAEALRAKAAAASSLRLVRLSLGFGLALACVGTRAQERPVTVITGATLIDGTTRPALQDAVIVIDGPRITQAGTRGSVAVPSGATVIDGQGRFVIPGLADMHHHLLSGSMRPIVNRPSV